LRFLRNAARSYAFYGYRSPRYLDPIAEDQAYARADRAPKSYAAKPMA